MYGILFTESGAYEANVQNLNWPQHDGADRLVSSDTTKDPEYKGTAS